MGRSRVAWRSSAFVLTVLSTLIMSAGSGKAVVVDMNPGASGAPSVSYPTDQGSYYGVALVPGTRANLGPAGVPTVNSSGPCEDPWLSGDLGGPLLPSNGICWHDGGSVLHSNETFALPWDPNPDKDYAAPYVEQFLRDVADGSGTLSSPYAAVTQYNDATGRAGNSSVYGGGFEDQTAYPGNGCTVSGTHHYDLVGNSYEDVPNDVCLTDAQLRNELDAMVVHDGIASRVQPGHAPLLVLLTPPGVETCLDGAGHLCSANSDSTRVPAQFCSYHSQINVGGVEYEYLVQPWSTQTGCDEPDVTPIPNPVDPSQLATLQGMRLVSPLSQAQLATIADPGLNGWFALNGSEINDNECTPIDQQLDKVTVGNSAQNPYFLQREFSNAGVIVNSPNSYPCTPNVVLQASFVVPSAVDAGDVVDFDGSESPASLLVPNANYSWNFGDGVTAVGPSVEHSYGRGGAYTVSLTVTDRGGNVSTLRQTVTVLGPSGQIVVPPRSPLSVFEARLQLLPEGLRTVLRHGIALRVSSNSRAAGVATVLISRSAARKAHIHYGHSSTVVIGRGTVSGVKNGVVHLHLKFSRSMVAKLKRLHHVSLTVRLSLVAAGNRRLTLDAAGRY